MIFTMGKLPSKFASNSVTGETLFWVPGEKYLYRLLCHRKPVRQHFGVRREWFAQQHINVGNDSRQKPQCVLQWNAFTWDEMRPGRRAPCLGALPISSIWMSLACFQKKAVHSHRECLSRTSANLKELLRFQEMALSIYDLLLLKEQGKESSNPSCYRHENILFLSVSFCPHSIVHKHSLYGGVHTKIF